MQVNLNQNSPFGPNHKNRPINNYTVIQIIMLVLLDHVSLPVLTCCAIVLCCGRSPWTLSYTCWSWSTTWCCCSTTPPPRSCSSVAVGGGGGGGREGVGG